MWRDWKIGQSIHYKVVEFDGTVEMDGVVTEVHDDHAIVSACDMALWVEDFNAECFERRTK